MFVWDVYSTNLTLKINDFVFKVETFKSSQISYYDSIPVNFKSLSLKQAEYTTYPQ